MAIRLATTVICQAVVYSSASIIILRVSEITRARTCRRSSKYANLLAATVIDFTIIDRIARLIICAHIVSRVAGAILCTRAGGLAIM